MKPSWIFLILAPAVSCLTTARCATADTGTRRYFVAADGNDDAAGDAAHPWATIQRAARLVKPGDTVIVRKGSYAGFVLGWDQRQDGTEEAPIRFIAEPGAIIQSRGSKVPVGINLENASHIVIDGFSITPSEKEDIWRAGIRCGGRGDGIVIRNNTLRMRPADHYGIYASFSRQLLVENNDVSGTINSGIYTANSTVEPILRHNLVHDCGGNGMHFNGDVSQGGNGVITGAVIEHNKVHNVGFKGGGGAINMDGVQGSVVRENRLLDNHAKGITLYQQDAADSSRSNLIEHNDIRMAGDANGEAITIKNGSTGNTLRGNVFHHRNAARGSIEISSDSLQNLASDHNTITAGITLNDGVSFLSLAQWQKRTGQDKNSTEALPNEPKRNAGTGTLWILLPLAAGVGCISALLLLVHRHGVHRWLIPYLAQRSRRHALAAGQPIHVLLCIADHFEPRNGKVSSERARARMNNWTEQYPRLFGELRDSDGRPPRHTFFYPLEQYDRWDLDRLAELCSQGFGEVEIHLHHDRDNAIDLRKRFNEYRALLADRHGLLSRRRDGEIAFGFVHGDWALDNSRPDGRCCGVNNELDVLRETGCYADFTLPSAPTAQTSKINSIYYACDDPHAPRSHDTGVDVGSGSRPDRALMLIQGPLLFNWNSRKWGLLPRIENGNLQLGQPPTMQRLQLWLRARVQVSLRPDWYFVKLHTHGAPEFNQRVILGEPMVQFHRGLAERHRDDVNFHYHYVTAREMYNLARAAEDGWTGSVNDARDYEIVPIGAAQTVA